MGTNKLCAILETAKEIYPELRDTFAGPWNIDAREYIRFALADIVGTDRRSIVNALGNAKRALECHTDTLLLALQFAPKKLNLPSKLELLARLGLVSPPVLHKINRHRNEMEHEYTCPTHDVVEDFVGIVELFVEAGRIHLEERIVEWTLEFSENRHGSAKMAGGTLVLNLPDLNTCSIPCPSEDYVSVIGTLLRLRRE